jgi:hypothetical protein
MCSQVLDILKMFLFLKVMLTLSQISLALLYLSRALYIFECINFSVQDLFLGELLQAMISLARD